VNPAMTPGQIVGWMSDRGFRFEVRGEQLHVIPEPESKLVVRLRAVKAELLAFVVEHGGTWPPIASTHRYVMWRGARDRAASVCLSCGCPPAFHGEDPLRDPLVVDGSERRAAHRGRRHRRQRVGGALDGGRAVSSMPTVSVTVSPDTVGGAF